MALHRVERIQLYRLQQCSSEVIREEIHAVSSIIETLSTLVISYLLRLLLLPCIISSLHTAVSLALSGYPILCDHLV